MKNKKFINKLVTFHYLLYLKEKFFKIQKKMKTNLILLFFCFNSFAQNYPFEFQKSGRGGEAIILLPGFACSGEVWNETIALLDIDFVCYSLTMSGFAGTKPQQNISFIELEKAIVSFIQNNSIQKPIIIGHSMGGGLAMALAADYPNLVSKIVVVDALPCLAALTNPKFQSNEKPDCTSTTNLMALSNEQFYEMQKATIPNLLSNTKWQETVIKWSVDSDRKTFATMYCDISNVDLRSKMQHITCPNLILLESYFVNFKPTIEQQFLLLKNQNIKYANKGLHFVMYDDFEWYSNEINNFIKPKK